MSERKPTEADLPVWFHTNGNTLCFNFIPNFTKVPDNAWTHWKPAVVPAPPAKDLTQREKDEEAFFAWNRQTPVCLRDGGKIEGGARGDGWHAALAYRDGQNREDLEALGFPLMHTDKHAVFASLRRRCGLDT